MCSSQYRQFYNIRFIFQTFRSHLSPRGYIYQTTLNFLLLLMLLSLALYLYQLLHAIGTYSWPKIEKKNTI